MTNQPISKRLRYEVLRRDNHACRYCGASAPDAKLTVDHVLPLALGGSNDASNLVAACVDCNAGKSSSSPDQPIVDDVAADALRWAKAIEQASEALLMDHVRRKELREQFLNAWLNWSYPDFKTKERVHIELPNNWANSVDTILATGLPIDVLLECVDLAMAAKHVRKDNLFRYMCGIAWRKVAELREVAEALLEADQEG